MKYIKGKLKMGGLKRRYPGQSGEENHAHSIAEEAADGDVFPLLSCSQAKEIGWGSVRSCHFLGVHSGTDENNSLHPIALRRYHFWLDCFLRGHCHFAVGRRAAALGYPLVVRGQT